jgi:class 3 adenylate cyclase
VKNLQSFYDILIGNLIVIILIAAGVTMFSMFSNLRDTMQEMSKGMIADRLSLTDKELHEIFDPIANHLQATRQRALKGVLKDFHQPEQLDAYFLPMLENSNTVSSVLIANDLGDEFMLLKQDSIWITRTTKRGSLKDKPVRYAWIDRDGHKSVLSRDTLAEAYDPRGRPWFKLAMENPNESGINWTSPYIFFTTRQPGMTASIKWTDPATGVQYVCAIDLLMSDLSSFTTTIDVTSNGKVFVLTEERQVIGLPRDQRFATKQVRDQYSLKRLGELGIPVIDQAIKSYQQSNSDANLISFSFESEVWWVGIKEYSLNDTKKLILGVAVPETDFAKDIETTRRLLVGGLVLLLLFSLIILYSFLRMKRANKIIRIERDKNEQLLLNTLPVKVVNDLKENGKSDPQKFKNVTVCFADIVGFTQISSKLDPKQLIHELNDIYTAFDEIMIRYDCERIKTMGDAYLSVCGMPQKNDRHAEMMLRAAIEIIDFISQRNRASEIEWKMRIGMHSGNVVGGIVGVKKYIYDVFGDTINTASRMESYSQPMHVNLSETTYQIVKDSKWVKESNIRFEKRSPAIVKGKGSMNMYFALVHERPTHNLPSAE